MTAVFPVPMTLRSALAAGLCDAQAVLADLDGCLISGDVVLEGAAELIARTKERLWIVSNNSTDTAEGLSARLAGLDLHLPPDRIVLAGEQTLERLSRGKPGLRLALYAGARMHERARALGLVIDHTLPELVVLARDEGFTFAALLELAGLVHRGLPLWVTNADVSHPGPDGTPRPETGALLAAVRAMVPGCRAVSIGKPAPDLVHVALSRAAIDPSRAVFVGDTPATDGVAAERAGMRFVHIAPPGTKDGGTE